MLQTLVCGQKCAQKGLTLVLVPLGWPVGKDDCASALLHVFFFYAWDKVFGCIVYWSNTRVIKGRYS